MGILIESMRQEDVTDVSAVLAKAYVTTPMHIAIFGENLRRNEVVMKSPLTSTDWQWYVVKEEGQIVGAMGMVEWPKCQASPLKMLPVLPTLVKGLGSSLLRLMERQRMWAKQDPKEPHWHFGPFGILPERQRQGIGSQLLTYFCERIDQLRAASYLETDKPENVRLYQRFGFTVKTETIVVGVPNWFMWRPPCQHFP
jgi:GNAT superfamily N-acetyltransferase